MGRNQKVNFDFFRIYTGFFKNKKIRTLRRAHGAIGVATYIWLLDYIFGNDGYYLKFEDIEQLCEDIAEDIAAGYEPIAKVASKVSAAILTCANSGLIDRDCLEKRVITGERIQSLYIELSTSCKRIGKIEEYRLIPDTLLERPMEETPITSEEKPISSEEIINNSEETPTSKDNISKSIKVSKNVYKDISNDNPRESYEDIMDGMGLEEEVRPTLWEFIKHCQLNGRTLTNDKLNDILLEMDFKQRLEPLEKIAALREAIKVGAFDVRRYR